MVPPSIHKKYKPCPNRVKPSPNRVKPIQLSADCFFWFTKACCGRETLLCVFCRCRAAMERSSVLWNPHCLNYLPWEDIETLLLLRRERVPERRNYVSRTGVINIHAIAQTTFRRQFRFEKADFPVLVSALDIPECVTSAQGVRDSGREALCMCLRRLAYPNRLCDLQQYFGRHYSVISSISNKVMLHIERNFGYLLDDLTNHRWLSLDDSEEMSNVSDALYSQQ